MRLIYSPDDAGYYFERYDFAPSALYPTKGQALAALRGGLVEWLCPRCRGTGTVRTLDRDTDLDDCPACQGTGRA